MQLVGASLAVPTLSSILFLCISVAVPDLYAVNSLRFPLNLTLPTIYVATLILTMTLMTRVGLSITRVPSALDQMKIWAEWQVLLSTLLVGIVVLSLLGLLGHGNEKTAEADR